MSTDRSEVPTTSRWPDTASVNTFSDGGRLCALPWLRGSLRTWWMGVRKERESVRAHCPRETLWQRLRVRLHWPPPSYFQVLLSFLLSISFPPLTKCAHGHPIRRLPKPPAPSRIPCSSLPGHGCRYSGQGPLAGSNKSYVTIRMTAN